MSIHEVSFAFRHFIIYSVILVYHTKFFLIFISAFKIMYFISRKLFSPSGSLNNLQLRERILIIKPTRCTNFSNLFWNKTLHFSDISFEKLVQPVGFIISISRYTVTWTSKTRKGFSWNLHNERIPPHTSTPQFPNPNY